MANYITTDIELTSIADAIRAKGGTVSPLAYPAGFISAINDISGGGPSISSLTVMPTSQSQVFYGAVSKSSVYASPTVNYIEPFGFSPHLNVGSTYFANIKFYTQEGYYLASESNLFFVCESNYVILDDDTGVQVSPSQGKCIDKGIYDYIALKVYETDQTTAFAPVTVLGYANSLGSKNITTNGTYNASSDGYVGYSQVTVNVSLPSENKELDIIQRTISGTYENTLVSYIGNGAFFHCSSLTSASFPNATLIGSSAFFSCPSLLSVYSPECITIGEYAFEHCVSLAFASFSKCTYIGRNAFYNNNRLSYASFPLCTEISSYAFYMNYGLTNIYFPECISMGSCAFSMANLPSANFPKLISIPNDAFRLCGPLSAASFPVCKYISAGAFTTDSGLTDVYFPECSFIGQYAFSGCTSLISISFPKCSEIFNNAFSGCYNLSYAYFPLCQSIRQSAFYHCSNFRTFIVGTEASSVCLLSATTAFTNCTNLSIYVPDSLVTDYKAATNWSIYSNRIFGISDLPNS